MTRWQQVGVDAQVLPCLVDPVAVVAPEARRQYLTFVNPEANKGVTVFARIAAELGRRRPDIPLLVVDSRGRALENLRATGVDLSGANLSVLPTTTDSRRIYATAKVVVMPSLWNESFGMVAAEALANGIPVVATDRGALPEIVGDAGFLLPIPVEYTPQNPAAPTTEEVAPWLAAIERLWDDAALYDETSRRGRERASRWTAAAVGPQLAEFFRNVRHQPGAPTIPVSERGFCP